MWSIVHEASMLLLSKKVMLMYKTQQKSLWTFKVMIWIIIFIQLRLGFKQKHEMQLLAEGNHGIVEWELCMLFVEGPNVKVPSSENYNGALWSLNTCS